MTHYRKQFAGRQPIFQDCDIVAACNVSQQQPHTAIAAGVTGLVFIECNLVNCDLPDDAQLFGCNVSQVDLSDPDNPVVLE